MKRSLLALALGACASASAPTSPTVSSTLALTSDDRALGGVNPASVSVSLLDPKTRMLGAEGPLAPPPPAVDPTTKRYEPAVKPRALAILRGNRKLYVAGQTANQVFVVD